MAKKYDLDPEEARNWRLAKMFDLRTFIGVLFVIFGVLVIIPGIIANPADIAKAAGINLALWVGGRMRDERASGPARHRGGHRRVRRQ